MEDARTIVEIRLPKGDVGEEWFDSLPLNSLHPYTGEETGKDTIWKSDVIQNGKLCPMEYFDVIRRGNDESVKSALQRFRSETLSKKKRGDLVLLLFVIKDGELEKLMRVGTPKESNKQFSPANMDQAFLYLRRWIHDQLIEQDKNGDSAATCIHFSVNQFVVNQTEDGIEIQFEEFYHNQHAKSYLGLSIDDATLFSKATFINQFQPKKNDKFRNSIWS